MNNGIKSYVSKMRNLVAKKAPKRKTCPKCKSERKFELFGIRTHKGPDGKPNRFSAQSYCVFCRSGKKAKKTATPKLTAVAGALS